MDFGGIKLREINEEEDIIKRLYPSYANPETWRNNIHDKITKEEWKKLRLKILRRDNYTCQYCGFRTEKWQLVHHLNGNPNNNEDNNLETICPMCNLINHSGQGCVIQGIVDLYEKTNYSQNEIIKITRRMRAQGKNDREMIEFLGLKEKCQFKMNKKYLEKRFGFVTSRKSSDDWIQRSLEYMYKIERQAIRSLNQQKLDIYE